MFETNNNDSCGLKAHLSYPSLLMCIQAVDQVMSQLNEERKNTQEPSADLEEYLLAFWKTSQELEEVYKSASVTNLTPYHKLVQNGGGL